MPIIVTEFSWKQTPTAVHITVPLRAAGASVDLFAADAYLKAHYRPFLLELFLRHDVVSERSRCTVKDDLLVLDLLKKEEQEWDQLEKDLTKSEKMKLRQEILERSQEKAKEAAEQKRIKKSEMDRFTVQKAMEIDTRDHSLMDSRRDQQRKLAMDALEEWRVGTGAAGDSRGGGVEILELPDDKENAPEIESKDAKPKETVTCNEQDMNSIHKVKPQSKSPQSFKPRPKKEVKSPVRSEYVEAQRAQSASRVLPAVRSGGGAARDVLVRHTPRAFPTPRRESAQAEEEAWLRNITLARRATGFVSEELRPEEQDPVWCKAKGDEFFRAGNLLGAVSAYSHGVSLSDRLPGLYANRAAAHFALGNFNKCVLDCSTALELLRPLCAANLRQRAACLARRAAGLARLGRLSHAIDEMKAAARLLPQDAALRADVHAMERAWEQNPDSD